MRRFRRRRPGVLAEMLVTEGQTVPVQTVVARIETEAGAVAAVAAPAASRPRRAAAAGARPKSESTAKSARHRRINRLHVAPAPTPPPARPAAGNGGSFEERLRTKSSPLVRKIAAEHGIEIAGLQGSGIAGRVTKRDIMEVIESGVAGASAARAVAPSMHAPGGRRASRTAARAMARRRRRANVAASAHSPRSTWSLSRRTNAHVTSFFEVDLTRVARIRGEASRETSRSRRARS